MRCRERMAGELERPNTLPAAEEQAAGIVRSVLPSNHADEWAAILKVLFWVLRRGPIRREITSIDDVNFIRWIAIKAPKRTLRALVSALDRQTRVESHIKPTRAEINSEPIVGLCALAL